MKSLSPDDEKFFSKNEFYFIEDKWEMTEVEQCPVCSQDYDEDDFLVKLFCKHKFHAECIKKWFENNSKCPMCRKDFRIHEEYKEYGLEYKEKTI